MWLRSTARSTAGSTSSRAASLARRSRSLATNSEQTDERDLFPQALRLIAESEPRAVIRENVRGFATKRFDEYRSWLLGELRQLGYEPDWRLLTASEYGVPQLRPRFVLVALRPEHAIRFAWPLEEPGVYESAHA